MERALDWEPEGPKGLALGLAWAVGLSEPLWAPPRTCVCRQVCRYAQCTCGHTQDTPPHIHVTHTHVHLAKVEAEVVVEARPAVGGEPTGRGQWGCECQPLVPHALPNCLCVEVKSMELTDLLVP